MAITLVGTPTNTGNSTSTTTRSVAVPTGAVSGDVAFVFIDLWDGSADPTPTIPSGFTQLYKVTGGTGVKSYCYWKRLTAADTGTYAFSWTTAMFSTVSCTMLRGVVTSGNPAGGTVAGTNYQTAFATSTTFPSVAVNPSTYIPGLLWHGYNDSAATHTPPTSPTGFTESVDVDCATDAYYFPTSGTSFTITGATASVSSAINAAVVAVQPAVPAGFVRWGRAAQDGTLNYLRWARAEQQGLLNPTLLLLNSPSVTVGGHRLLLETGHALLAEGG